MLSESATPARSTSSRCMSNPRERVAVERHLARNATKRSSVHCSSKTTPRRCTNAPPEQHIVSGCKPLAQGERDAVERHVEHNAFESSKPLHSREQSAIEKHCEGVAMPSHVFAQKQLAGDRRPLAQTTVAQPASPGFQVASIEKADADDKWAHQAANPEERAERARVLTRAKFEQKQASQRARVFVFKGRESPSTRKVRGPEVASKAPEEADKENAL